MSFERIIYSIPARTFFLIDALGALLSTLMLGGVLTQFADFFGMPLSFLLPLSTIAGIFALYSTTCFLSRPKNWKLFLRIIATANLLYCLLTVGVVAMIFSQLTVPGRAYFIGEAVIVTTLAIAEYKRTQVSPAL